MCYVLPIFLDDIMFAHNGLWAWLRGRRPYSQSDLPGGSILGTTTVFVFKKMFCGLL